jgi:Tfp pilus assembly protein PilX
VVREYVVRRRGESGTALLMALFVIFLLSVALALLAVSLQIRMRLAREDAETVILSGLADAAVAEAVANLAQSAYYSGSPAHDFGDGRIESRVEPVSPGIFDVTATATYAGRKRAVAAEVFRAPGVARVRRWRRLPGVTAGGRPAGS